MINRFIWLIIFIISFGLCGCGYWMYYAHYMPPERIEEVKNSPHWSIYNLTKQELPILQNGLAVNFGMWRNSKSKRKNRECFSVHIDLNMSDLLKNDSSIFKIINIKNRISIDSVVITCNPSGLNEVRTVSLVYNDTAKLIYRSSTICLPRKHHLINVHFRINILNEDNSLKGSKSYDIELERWENRNWLGLE